MFVGVWAIFREIGDFQADFWLALTATLSGTVDEVLAANFLSCIPCLALGGFRRL